MFPVVPASFPSSTANLHKVREHDKQVTVAGINRSAILTSDVTRVKVQEVSEGKNFFLAAWVVRRV
jgi:hypothetical protein